MTNDTETSTAAARPEATAPGGKKGVPPANKKSRKASSRRPHRPKANVKALNQQIVRCESASEVLQTLQSIDGALTQFATGGQLNTVNLSTALHRLAKHSLTLQRASILSDARFALLLASTAEAITTMPFGPREFSNMGWALAKLKIVPPASAQPIAAAPSNDALQLAARQLREVVLTAMKEQRRQSSSSSSSLAGTVWVPALSSLAGLVLDRFSVEASGDFGGGFRMQEYSNLLWAWATVGRAESHVFAAMARKMIAVQQEQMQAAIVSGETPVVKPQEWSNTIWAFATAQIYEGHTELIEFVANLVKDERIEFLEHFKPQELSNTVWGLATLEANNEPAMAHEDNSGELSLRTVSILTIVRAVAQAVATRADQFKTQELSNTLWSLATLGFGLRDRTTQSSTQYTMIPTDNAVGDAGLKEAALSAIIRASIPLLRRFRSQELNNLAWALARLTDRPDPHLHTVLEGIARQMCDDRRQTTAQDICTTLWSLATLEFHDEALYRRLCSLLTLDVLAQAKPQELSITLWGIATAEISLDQDCYDTTIAPSDVRRQPKDNLTWLFGAVADEFMRRPQNFKPQELKDVLWSFSRIGIRHPKLFRFAAEHLAGADDSTTEARGLADFEPQGLGNLAWAFARQAQLAEEAQSRLRSIGNGGKQAIYTAAFFDIGERTLNTLFRSIVETDLSKASDLSHLKPQDLSNRAWALALLGFKHAEFMKQTIESVKNRMRRYCAGDKCAMTTFKGQEIANLLWALAVLNVPDNELLDAAANYLPAICAPENDDEDVSLHAIAAVFKRQELGNIIWACTVFDSFPRRLVDFLYKGLVGDRNSDDATSLARLFMDGGMQPQGVMSLIYAHAAMQLGGRPAVQTLPDDFPEAWQQSGGSRSSFDELQFELDLKTSKIQQDVGRAYERVGFEHTEEFVISLSDLAAEYGLDVPAKVVEVLSIDIADPKRKIAIEVDGPAHFISRIDSPFPGAGFTKRVNPNMDFQFKWSADRQEYNGPAVLKRRMLESLGWRVINIPFWNWYVFPDEKGEDAYCKETLEDIYKSGI